METVKLTNEKTLKFILVHGIGALILIAILGYAVPDVGTVQFSLVTGIAIVLGSGLGALVVAHLKMNVLIEAIIAGFTAVGGTAVLYLVMGAPLGSLIGVVFAGNFLMALGSYYYKKGKRQ